MRHLSASFLLLLVASQAFAVGTITGGSNKISTAGLATSALQTTGNASLSSIDTKLTSEATAAKQDTGNTSLSSIDGKLTNAATTTLQTTGNSSLSSIDGKLTTISTNVSQTPINTAGSGSGAGATVSTVATLTAPANAVGFVLMNLDTSTLNVRWSVGRTASATLGQQLQPGRDTGFIPVGANVSVCAESGTQNIDIQWVTQ